MGASGLCSSFWEERLMEGGFGIGDVFIDDGS
jgi:hypothetical protein